jgi:hypothetical protein
MKNFDQRWQTCAGQARQAAPPDEAAPFGFAARVVALASRPAPASGEEVWGGLVWRLLAGALPVLLLCLLLEGRHLRGPRPLEPGVQNAVAQLVWRL